MWVKTQVKIALKYGLDGINVDFEEPLERKSLGSIAYVRLVQELVRQFHYHIPGKIIIPN